MSFQSKVFKIKEKTYAYLSYFKTHLNKSYLLISKDLDSERQNKYTSY